MKNSDLLFNFFTIVLLSITNCQFQSAADVLDNNYLRIRNNLIEQDRNNFFGAAVQLSPNEEVVNQHLIKLKKSELDFFKSNSSFLPGKNFLLVKNYISQSKVFQFIQRIPKGASLHAHLLASVDPDYVINNLTYLPNVYGCWINSKFKLKIFPDPLQTYEDAKCSKWQRLSVYRNESNQKQMDFDVFLRNQITLNESAVVQDREVVWQKFKSIFECLYDLISYRPVFKQYVYRMLQELYDDHIFYTEIRGTFMPLYDSNNGTSEDPKIFLDTFLGVIEEFKATHPKFIGLKYIYNIYRGVQKETLRSILKQVVHYKKIYPNFIAGIDFVGQEDESQKLVTFHHELLEIMPKLKFYFHAGETNQYGGTDLNLFDAIMLNSSRIGHGFGLTKHRELMTIGKCRDIAVELCPISNQVLKLVDDPRNHPGVMLLSENYPVVIGNDDPAAWGATGVSYDWYVVFLSMTWPEHGLRVLKKLAENSIVYSAMNTEERDEALKIWERQWNDFIIDQLERVDKEHGEKQKINDGCAI
ncbi:hypothetical protein ABEB36_001822 [Hypothenemus hampei]|uniref:Adenosine deaminase n=1 Tax=Hypothenemus hampei TaxID=57062 RepID=A0ABD1FIG7_HYPHA